MPNTCSPRLGTGTASGAPRMAACSLGAGAQCRSTTSEVQSLDADLGCLRAFVVDDGRSTCATRRPPQLISPGVDAVVACTTRAPLIHSAVTMTAVSPEEAALAAGALAELRASVAVAVARLDVLERELADDVYQRQEFARTFLEVRYKQAETSNQVSAMHARCADSASKFEEAVSEWHTRSDHLDSFMLTLESSCKDSSDASSNTAAQVGTLHENCIRFSHQLKEWNSEWNTKHQHVDSRMLSLEQCCRDLQVRVEGAAESAKTVSCHLPVQVDFERQLTDLNACLQEQGSWIRACQEGADHQATSCEQVRCALDVAVSRSESDCAELRQRLVVLEDGADEAESRLAEKLVVLADGAGEGQSRLAALESFRGNLVKDPPWVPLLAASCAKGQTVHAEVGSGWEVEARLRDVAEEVCTVSERAMTAYIDAARADLSQRLEDIAKQCLDSVQSQLHDEVLPNLLEGSLSCSDAFPEEAVGLDLVASDNQGDCAGGTEAVATSCVDAACLVPNLREAPTELCDGGTGGYQHRVGIFTSPQRWPAGEAPSASSTPCRAAPAAASPVRYASERGAPVAAPPPSSPIWRPAGVAASKRREAPPGGARRLRSSSPGQPLPDGGMVPLAPPRAPSLPPCLAGAVELQSES